MHVLAITRHYGLHTYMSVVKMFVQALRKFPLTMFLRLTKGKHSANYYVVLCMGKKH